MAVIVGSQNNFPIQREKKTPTTNPRTGARSSFTFEEETESVTRYWGSKPEQAFVASLRSISKLYEESPVDVVAVRITDFETPDIATGMWIAYSGEPIPDDKNRKDVYYLLLDSVYFYGDDQTPALNKGTGTSCLAARLGRALNGDFEVYISAAGLLIDPDLGNGSGSPGVKIKNP